MWILKPVITLTNTLCHIQQEHVATDPEYLIKITKNILVHINECIIRWLMF